MRCFHLLGRIGVGLTILALGACAHPVPADSVVGVKSPVADGSRSAFDECPRKLVFPKTAQRRARIVLLGEVHGTHEIPEFVGDLACSLAEEGETVRVGLEIPVDEEPALRAFLSSDGTAADRALLLEGRFWSFPDGRSSVATLKLIDRLRIFSKRTRIDVFLFDVPEPYKPEGREEFMAAEIMAESDAHPEDTLIVYTGNLHARTVKGTPWKPDYRPMGMYLRENGRNVLSFDASIPAGDAWICTGPNECGITKLKGNQLEGQASTRKEEVFRLFEAVSPSGFDGVFRLHSTTAALPARPQPPSEP